MNGAVAKVAVLPPLLVLACHCPEEEKLQLDKEKRAKKKKLFWIRILLPLGLGRFLVPSSPTKLFGFFA